MIEASISTAQSKVQGSFWQLYVNTLIAREISRLTRYCERLIQWLPRKEDNGLLLDLVECPKKERIQSGEALPDLRAQRDESTTYLLNGTINHHFDIQGLLLQLKKTLSRTSRVVVVCYNPYLAGLYKLANILGLRRGEVPTTFVTRTDFKNLTRLAGYEVVRERPVAYVPFSLLGLGTLINTLLAGIPGIRWLSFAYVATLRPIIAENEKRPSLSIVIPARNERGNIENALKRMPNLGCKLEIIFVEGHSSDKTWEEIQRVVSIYKDKFQLQAFQQTGKGKSDAVRLGFSRATGDLLTILDADLTMPPEMLERFYNAYCEGQADFINGSRLVYPMEGEAMRFLNHLGNVFFAKALSWVLDVKLGDSLCGTKLVSRRDYQRMIDWRRDFGDFDPFGDFELIFPAATLGLGIVDIPIRYLARTYGTTNIHRFRHGLMLLRMTTIGFLKIRLGVKWV